MGEIHQYHHQQPHQSQPEPESVFEQRQQQKLMKEQSVDNFSFFNYFNIQYNNNNNYHQQQQQQQQQQTLQQFQNLPTNYRGSFPSNQHFHPQQYVEQQQRRLQPENRYHHHHYQQPSCSRDNNNNNFRGFITGGCCGGGGIPIPSIPLDLNGSCRNENEVTASQFTSVVRPSHFWTLNTDISGDRRDKSGDYINEADDNDKDREYHNQNQNHQPEMNQNQKQNFGYDDHGGQEASSRKYLSELEKVLCGNTSTSSPPQPSILDEFIINHLNAEKAGKQVVKEVVEQEMQPSPSMVADHDHDHDTKKKKRSRERDEEIIKLIQTLVKQFLNQQEVLFMKFMERIEKMDKERKEREESWRRREIENLQLEFSVFPKSHIENGALQTMPPPTTTTATTTTARDAGSGSGSGSKRWPDEEVNALIQERMKLAERFQEPGLKWPLWKEISNRMCSMGYHLRDAKRCKEKWDNINKYFRKYREQIQDGRRQKLKTCVYFDKLDQLYNSNSNSIINGECYGGGGGGGDVDLQQIQGEEISLKKTDVLLVEEEEVEVEWDELDSRF